MMGRVVGSLCFLAVLVSTVSAATDDAIRVEVERPRLFPDTVLDPSARLNLAFDARFTNQGDAPLEIPDRAATARVPGISKHGVEAQQSDGSWRTVEGGGDLMWKGDTVFPRCKLLNPKESLEAKGVSGPFVVFKSNLGGLWGTTATIRLHLLLTCKQRDGKLMSKIVKTNPFVLAIPPLP